MLVIAGHDRVRPERRDALVAEFEDLVRRARECPGCLDVAITADSVDPARINNVERWESAEHLDAWRAVARRRRGAPLRRRQPYDATNHRPPF